VAVARVAFEAREQRRDHALAAFDELAERVAVEDEQAGDVVAQVVGARLLADAAHLVRIGPRHLADVEKAEEPRSIARVGAGSCMSIEPPPSAPHGRRAATRARRRLRTSASWPTSSPSARRRFLLAVFFAAVFLAPLFFAVVFFALDFFALDFLAARFGGGTLPPSLRASERPIAIACFLLVTFLPERPLFSEPCLRSCIASSTLSDAFLPYVAMVSSFLELNAVHGPWQPSCLN
jgi:hypothetical protein